MSHMKENYNRNAFSFNYFNYISVVWNDGFHIILQILSGRTRSKQLANRNYINYRSHDNYTKFRSIYQIN